MTASFGSLLAAMAGPSRPSHESSTDFAILFSPFIADTETSFAKTGSIPVARPWTFQSFMISTTKSNRKGN